MQQTILQTVIEMRDNANKKMRAMTNELLSDLQKKMPTEYYRQQGIWEAATVVMQMVEKGIPFFK